MYIAAATPLAVIVIDWLVRLGAPARSATHVAPVTLPIGQQNALAERITP
jgi:hypothetical protein